MKKTVIKTCSCFVDKAIWFVNLSQKRVVNPWRFDCVRSEGRLIGIIENKFIKEIRLAKIIVDEKICFKDTIVISCVDCFNFQLFLLSFEENCMLDTLNCRFVTSDCFSYDDDYSSDIFTGNSQFVHENYFYLREQRELLFRDANVKLSKQHLHKSCFISLQKKRYRFFCTTCKRAYNEFLEGKLHVFSSVLKE